MTFFFFKRLNCPIIFIKVNVTLKLLNLILILILIFPIYFYLVWEIYLFVLFLGCIRAWMLIFHGLLIYLIFLIYSMIYDGACQCRHPRAPSISVFHGLTCYPWLFKAPQHRYVGIFVLYGNYFRLWACWWATCLAWLI